ncbi:MFS transporter [Aerococcus urinae]|uniref:MFS transporter n=1 Tax=Aerococcus urinae TaxID=1376 RepID=UPI00254B484A|nr:MFS transporter [Aerococcus urinae]MDK7303277.1 MFS transporter [Aerococcus urinae]
MSTKQLPWKNLLILAFIACIAMISELLPSGFLQEMASAFNVPLGRMSLFIGTYAIMSAAVGIPITRAFSQVNRKTYLLWVCGFFAVSNLFIAFAPNFLIAFLARIIAGAAAGALWAMLGSYPIGFLPLHLAGRGTAIVLAGVTFGLSVGLPLATLFAKAFGWRMGFVLITLLFIASALLGLKLFPPVEGEEYNADNNYGKLLKNKGILIASLATILIVMAQYISYIFIQLIAQTAGIAVASAQAAFGVGALLSIGIVARFIDRYLFKLTLAISALTAIAIFILVVNVSSPFINYMAFALWGLGFAPMTTLLQTATTKQVDHGKALANSVSATSYDLAIMLSSLLGSLTIASLGLDGTLWISIGFALAVFFLVFFNHKYFT